jgi:hypothetical protein
MLGAVRAAKRAGRAHRPDLELVGRRAAVRPRRVRRPVRRLGDLARGRAAQARPGDLRLGAEKIGLPPEACVFVDDLGGNLKPAKALGMATIRHTSADETIPQLEQLLGVALR